MWFSQANLGAGLCGTGPPRQSILCLGEPEKSYRKLLRDFCGPVCEVSMACSKHGLRVIWLKSLPLGTV